MSSYSSRPLHPLLGPPRSHLLDPLLSLGGLRVDAPRDEHAELCAMEAELEQRRKDIAKSYSEVKPMGKTSQEPLGDEDDEEDDDDDDDDDDDNAEEEEEEEDMVDMDVNLSQDNTEDPRGAATTGATGGHDDSTAGDASQSLGTASAEQVGERSARSAERVRRRTEATEEEEEEEQEMEEGSGN